MPVVINEFEVISEPPPAPSEPQAQSEAQPTPPHEVEAIVKRLHERQIRIRAT